MTTSVEDILMFDKYPIDQMRDKKFGNGNHGQYIYAGEANNSDTIPVVQSGSTYSQPPTPLRMHASTPAPMRCIDIYEHVSSCPICMKMYTMDKTPYYIVIVLLSIVCILLLKKVLEK